jgi:hypothetical protein
MLSPDECRWAFHRVDRQNRMVQKKLPGPKSGELGGREEQTQEGVDTVPDCTRYDE